MTRLARILGLAAALGLGGAVLACAFFHDSYPPSSGSCEKTSDCVFGETCSDAGQCEPTAMDAGTDAGSLPDGGSHAG
jgi:hypothetical protein